MALTNLEIAFIGGMLLFLAGVALLALGFLKLHKHKKKLLLAGGIVLLAAFAAMLMPIFYPQAIPVVCTTPGEEPFLHYTIGFRSYWDCEQPDPLAGALCDEHNQSRCAYYCDCTHRPAICARHSNPCNILEIRNGTCMGIAAC
jgi:hypothetical protein